MSEAQTAQTVAAEVAPQEVSLLDQIITENRIGQDEEQRVQSRRQIATLVEEVLKGTVRVSKDLEATINARIADIDGLLSRQLNAIMHAQEFQKLEASWRGLHYLVHQSETSTMLKIKVLNTSKDDLRRDLERASEFDQSALFKKIYEEEYGTFGGVPFAVLIGDYEFGRHPQDVALLEKISHVAAAAHAPFIAAANPQLFNLDSFTEIGVPRDLAKIFDTVEYARWRSFRESEDARYVGLVLPHILMRLPYGQDTAPVAAFNFEEDVSGTDHSKYLWSNAAYTLGTRLTDAFARYSWCAAIRGVEGGGLVQGLPTHTFEPWLEGHDSLLQGPSDAITVRRTEQIKRGAVRQSIHEQGVAHLDEFGGHFLQRFPPGIEQGFEIPRHSLFELTQALEAAVWRLLHHLRRIVEEAVENGWNEMHRIINPSHKMFPQSRLYTGLLSLGRHSTPTLVCP